ncbi:hypothetical protein R1sor_006149 [Riccia sorocarpa]|uniref:Pantoate--beta-alanine ligase n=1 Tax=Riccia sorocarpa TaxID=122646 RepID=A0ABD3HM27_9MARC
MGQLELIRDKAAMRQWTRSMKKLGFRVAFVPTMGYLHEGHLSLVREAKARADRVVVSIYVNPGQFAPGEDLSIYPRDLEGDLAKLEPIGVDAVFNPFDLYVRDQVGKDAELIASNAYGNGHETWVRVEKLEKPLCGVSRPTFFRGVATVVTKLFNIVEPDVAVFGKKDYQQFRVLCRMVRDLDFDIEMVGIPVVREQDGLAMSSRNVRLSPEERQKVSSGPKRKDENIGFFIIILSAGTWCLLFALKYYFRNDIHCFGVKALSISQSLRAAEESVTKGESDATVLIQQVRKTLAEAGGDIDYVEIAEQESLRPVTTLDSPVVLAVAVRFGNVRLLDNIEL